MKHQWKLSFLLLICFAQHCLLSVQAASIPIETGSSNLLLSRQARGNLYQPCKTKHTPKCNTGLTCNHNNRFASLGTVNAPCGRNSDCTSGPCFVGKCLGATNRPLLAPCSTDVSCTSGYCNSLGYCFTPKKIGGSCNRNAQCVSKYCNLTSKKCATPTRSTTPVSNPSPTAVASAALASATTVLDSTSFNSNSLLQGPGTVKSFGSVAIVTTSLGPEIQAYADSTTPAVIEEVLQTSLARRQQTAYVMSFNYNVIAFVTNNTASGICNIVPSINGNSLSPTIPVTTGTKSGTAFYDYTGTVSSYAIALVCDANSNAKVQYDTVTVAPSTSSSPSSSSTTTTTTSTTSSATAAPTTTSCSGFTNCGLELGKDVGYFDHDASTGGGCGITNNTDYIHSGSYAELCGVVNTGKSSFAFLYGGVGHTYAVNSSYTLVFWVKFDKGANAQGLSCQIAVEDGDLPADYTGICPLTTTAPQNGFYQVALPFTATNTDISVYIDMNVTGTYAFDDFSMLDGTVSFEASKATTTTISSYTPTSASTSSTPLATQNCVTGITNCGFETGDSTGYTPVIHGDSTCGMETTPSEVHAGNNVYTCTIQNTNNTSNEIGLLFQVSAVYLLRYDTYTFTFWSKNDNASPINCNIGKGGYTYFNGDIPVTTATGTNGYSQYSTTFTINEDDFGAIGTFECTASTPGSYYFDDFQLTPQSTQS